MSPGPRLAQRWTHERLGWRAASGTATTPAPSVKMAARHRLPRLAAVCWPMRATLAATCSSSARRATQVRAILTPAEYCALLLLLKSGLLLLLCSAHGPGTLCGACLPGRYVTTDMECKPCPSLGRTISLGLLSFSGSAALVLYTTYSNTQDNLLTEESGPGEVGVSDVLKVRSACVEHTALSLGTVQLQS
jgi:hypothetical protein